MIRTILSIIAPAIAACVLSLQTGQAAEPGGNGRVLKIATIDWCPQLCPNSENKGYIHDIVEAVFEPGWFRLEFQLFPWSRAIQSTRQGRTMALLSPAKEEAPDLVYPQTPVGYQQMCFFARKGGTWRYSGVESLKDKVVGVALNTSVPGLNAYIKDHPQNFEFQPYSDSYLDSSMRMLKAGRMDAFLFTRHTTLYEMQKFQEADGHEIVGCVEKSPVYVGFSPASSLENDVASLAAYFDARFKTLEQTGVIQQIMQRYQIRFD